MIKICIGASAAIVLVLLVRRPLRVRFGAHAAYQMWLMVPATMLAAALPSMKVSRVMVVESVSAIGIGQLGGRVAGAVPMQWDGALLWTWLAGALAAAILFAVSHRRFTASLGTLTHTEGVFVAATSAQGPALLGIWRPRIVLPADFSSRYSAGEQALIIAHEQRHARRGDPIVNAFIALLQCAFWFNPLVHMAAARCRFDQELACDADVIENRPGQIRDYAAAMLKTQVGSALAPVTCHWQSSHPLKERIMQLNRTKLKPAARLAARALVATLLATSVMGTMAVRAEPAHKTQYAVDLKMTFAGEYTTPLVLTTADEPFTLKGETRGKTWLGEFVVTEGKDGLVWLKSTFTIDGVKGGYHNGGTRPGGSQHMSIMNGDNMVMVIDATVSIAPEGGVSQKPAAETMNWVQFR